MTFHLVGEDRCLDIGLVLLCYISHKRGSIEDHGCTVFLLGFQRILKFELDVFDPSPLWLVWSLACSDFVARPQLTWSRAVYMRRLRQGTLRDNYSSNKEAGTRRVIIEHFQLLRQFMDCDLYPGRSQLEQYDGGCDCFIISNAK